MTLTTKTRWWSGTSLKLIACTNGQTIQFFCSAFAYVLSSLSFGLVPSIIAMLLRKTKRLVLAKIVWSAATRATISKFLFFNTILFCRNLNQVVAAGPKIAKNLLATKWTVLCMNAYLHRTMPCDQSEPIHGSLAPSSPPIVVPWYRQ